MKIQGEIAFKSDDFMYVFFVYSRPLNNFEASGTPWRSNTTDDALAVERHAAFRLGVFADPVYTTGDWPTIMTDTLSPSYLPRFTAAEKKDLLGRPLTPIYRRFGLNYSIGSADFFAIDSYRTQWISAPPDGLAACVQNTSHPMWPECNTPVLYDSNAGWAAGPNPDPLSATWLQATPNQLRPYLKEVQKRWPTKKMVPIPHYVLRD
jgi:Glycosyl hydrolase family 1